jgi:hypothetical protein
MCCQKTRAEEEEDHKWLVCANKDKILLYSPFCTLCCPFFFNSSLNGFRKAVITTSKKLINSDEKFVDFRGSKTSRESHYVNEVFTRLIVSASLCEAVRRGRRLILSGCINGNYSRMSLSYDLTRFSTFSRGKLDQNWYPDASIFNESTRSLMCWSIFLGCY